MIHLQAICVQNPKSAADDDIFPDGTQVRKGNMIMYAPYAMGRLPALWGPDATEYRPERWLVNGVVQQESPFKFVAFQVTKLLLPWSLSPQKLKSLRRTTWLCSMREIFRRVPTFIMEKANCYCINSVYVMDINILVSLVG